METVAIIALISLGLATIIILFCAAVYGLGRRP